ncbi:amidohydrolase family protein [Puniceibacterium sp. IMCC21224]|uniref:amidohydrolase family protein n=1 Tax=Puniceibacterium sp. IMCC21224 TaxID=1618204 RepID=UPI00064D9D1D|nr:amidohydrolase [Puniceibacterium sp. IMCC21224]KMK64978.1 cytosine deaminase-like metal-dependent hydrolase [Puniceibacterium sp. IMCC21224]
MTESFKIIRNGLLPDDKTGRPERRDILVQDNLIVEIGVHGMDAPIGAEEIDAEGFLLMPGLVNAHSHGHGALGRGLGDRWTLEHLLHAGPWMNGGRELEDMALTARLNAAEMLLNGCTSVYDLYFEFPGPTIQTIDAVAGAYEEVGVRSVIAPMMADLSLYQALPELLAALPEDKRARFENVRMAPTETLLSTCRELLSNWRFDTRRTKIALAPTIPLHCTEEFLIGCRDLSAEFEVGLHMHLAESRIQAVTGMQRYGQTLTSYLDGLGMLSERFTGAHCVWMDDDDLRRMGDNGASIAHNPGSNMRLGNGISPARRSLAAGVNLGIGTDGSSCSDDQNMFISMRLASFASRIVSPDTSDWLSTREVLDAATKGSAKALGFGDSIGRIKAGAEADIVFLDLDSIGFVPLNDPVNQIVHAQDSSSVRHVMVAGEIVLKDRKFTRIDFSRLRHEAQTAADRLLANQSELRDFASSLNKYVSGFCVGMAQTPYHVDRWCNHHSHSQ